MAAVERHAVVYEKCGWLRHNYLGGTFLAPLCTKPYRLCTIVGMRLVHPSVYLKSKEQKKRRRPKLRYFGVLAFFLVASYGYLAFMVKPIYYVKETYPQVVAPGELTFEWPNSGSAAIGYVGASKVVLSSVNGKKIVPSASTIKLLTALVVVNQKPLQPGEDGETILFDSVDVAWMNEIVAAGGSYFPVTDGMVMTYRQALEATLIGSANNIAEKLAAWTFGDLAGYKTAAASYLQSKGIVDTKVEDSGGLSPSTTTTAEDMLKISLLSLEVPVLRAIVGLNKSEINGTNVTSTNTLLGSHGIDGIKTGYTLEAGNCLLLSKTVVIGSKDYTFVSVVLGQPDRATSFAEADRLLSVLGDNMHEAVVLGLGSTVATVATPWGEVVDVKAKNDIKVLRWQQESLEATVDLDTVTSAKKGDKVGTVKFDEQRAALILAEDLPAPSFWWRLANAFDALGQII